MYDSPLYCTVCFIAGSKLSMVPFTQYRTRITTDSTCVWTLKMSSLSNGYWGDSGG